MRSYSINPPVGGSSDPNCPGGPWLDFAGMNVYYKLGAILNPGPYSTFVFMDAVSTGAASLLDGAWAVPLSAYRPVVPP